MENRHAGMTTCDHLGPQTGQLKPDPGSRGLFIYECRLHGTTTIPHCLHECQDSTVKTGCASCLTPQTTVETVKQLLRGKPAAWPEGWETWPNVIEAKRQLI